MPTLPPPAPHAAMMAVLRFQPPPDCTILSRHSMMRNSFAPSSTSLRRQPSCSIELLNMTATMCGGAGRAAAAAELHLTATYAQREGFIPDNRRSSHARLLAGHLDIARSPAQLDCGQVVQQQHWF